MDPDQIDPASEGRVLSPDDGDYLRFERTLAHPPAEVWQALTHPDRTAAWAYRTEFEPREGGAVTMSSGGDGEVLAWDEPHALEYAWEGYGGRWHVRIAIADSHHGTLLTFDHVAPDPNNPDFAAGWHWHLDRLEQHLAGEEPAQVDSDAHFEELQRLYTHAEG
ncbi:SRPBCC family protein [Demequina silvatica]|uniref:SRPBCC family protein n=1 Tax=Demequina silvatica TaxID=1638988 RepID=UPI0007853E35|nr:SRPBCC family protein [Demequina silvatica]